MRKQLLFFIWLMSGCASAWAQQHDPGFHDAQFRQGSNPAAVGTIARQPDGRILVIGSFTTVDGHPTRGVARLLPTGFPDTSFAGTLPGQVVSSAHPVAVQPDGRILLWADSTQPVVRLLPTGRPDATFVLDTSAALRSRLRSYCSAISVQPDGRIVVAGRQTLTRLTADGHLDTSFQPPAFSPDTDVRGVCLEPGGSIAYITYNNLFNQAATGRLLANGVPDTSFAPSTFNQADIRHLLRLADGRYLVAGHFFYGSGHTQDIIRLSAAGALDSTFVSYNMGVVLTTTFIGSPIRTLAVQRDGRILAAGWGSTLFASVGGLVPLVRCASTGALDPGFDENYFYMARSFPGIPNSTYNGAGINDLLAEPDGKILVAGSFELAGGQPSYGLTRLLAAQVLAVAPATAAPAAQLWPNPAHNELHLRFDGATLPRRVVLFDAQGRTVQTTATTSSPNLTLNTAGLAAGLYLLRLDYASRSVMQRVAVE